MCFVSFWLYKKMEKKQDNILSIVIISMIITIMILLAIYIFTIAAHSGKVIDLL